MLITNNLLIGYCFILCFLCCWSNSRLVEVDDNEDNMNKLEQKKDKAFSNLLSGNQGGSNGLSSNSLSEDFKDFQQDDSSAFDFSMREFNELKQKKEEAKNNYDKLESELFMAEQEMVRARRKLKLAEDVYMYHKDHLEKFNMRQAQKESKRREEADMKLRELASKERIKKEKLKRELELEFKKKQMMLSSNMD